MAEINCPMCGKPNPDELDICQFCEARLKPLTDELSRSQPPIHPGDDPTPMDTGELEPVLPQWLREVRQQARDSVEEEPEQAPAQEDAEQADETPDLLAGLQSQADDDEEIPDWLTGLRGESKQEEPEESLEDDDDLAALKNMLGDDDPVSQEQESEDSSLPGWISDLGESETESQTDADDLSAFLAEEAQEDAQPVEAQAAASDSGLEWAADFGSDSSPSEESPDEVSSVDDTAVPDWLQGDEQPKSKAENDTPDLLSSLDKEGADTDPQPEPAKPTGEDDMPEWLSSLDGEAAPTQGDAPEQVAAFASDEEQSAFESETPDWLSSLGKEDADEVSKLESEPSTPESDMPDWLASLGDENTKTVMPQEPEQAAAESDVPDWLKSPSEESETTPEDESAQAPAFIDDDSEPALQALDEETPDWLSSPGETSTVTGETSDQSAPKIDEPAEKTSASSAFVDDEGSPLSTDDVDALLSTDMPDWLSNVDDQAKISISEPEPNEQPDDLSPADLPNWVQAMRPVESVITETDGEDAESQPLEEIGPLAGLRGVLPAVPGVGPSSKPKAYSIKLQASEDQQSNAVMLEQLLAEEINPKPMLRQAGIQSQRILRWLISVLLLLVVGGTVFTGTRINPMPTSAPIETSNALRYIQEILPEDAPVLMIFDYEAALAGELEATAAPMVDHMLLLKHPRLSLVSSTPTGTGLAERFMRNTQASHNYQRNQQFINLGYLPGGAASVLAFSETPVFVKPISLYGQNAWEMPALNGVGKISDFAAIILLTSDAESARIWIEQTENTRGETRFLVVSSAQSGPMILPYVQSGQVDGMVTGLDGSAPIEQANSGRPGLVRSYWDAYGFGLLTVIVIISLGSLWSLITGWQARRKEQGEG